ncbi:MAG TPA: M20 family metallopeptidase [Candidatus Limnocylindrales bacterium]|nr:M20 family metallopeptidase [Candidatus Limnocylindrales bacterium]
MTDTPVELSNRAAAEPHSEAKTRLAGAVDEARDEILELSHRIHANPEPAFEEHRAAAWVAEAVGRHGYQVEHPAGRLPTAVRGRLAGGRGSDGPRIAILAEYDALPGLGHGCGHNTMAASGVGAAIALAKVAPEIKGEVVFLGTPAEERGSGKQFMLDDGLFEGVDAALLFHPSDVDSATCALLASVDVEVTFRGLQAHAAADPWMGRNALDALITLFHSVGLWRQQLRPSARVHGIILEGGTAANIIPDITRARFMVRSDDQADFERMKERFARLVEAAALSADCEGEAVFSGGSDTMKDNEVLKRLWLANAAAYDVPDVPFDYGRMGSSDMGNVSQHLPTIHPQLAICQQGVAGHSTEFRDAAATPHGDRATLLAATLVAQTAYDLFSDPSLVEAAWQEFRGG